MTNLPALPPTSLLEDTDVRSLNELFNADPLGLSDTEIDTIAQYMRNKHALFIEEEKSGGSGPKAIRSAAAAAAKAPPKEKISIENFKSLIKKSL